MAKAALIAMIQAVAFEHGLDPKLMLAIAQQESSLRPHVVGSSGDVGLFQMSPRTARAYGCALDRLLDPTYNARCAARYLVDLKRRWKRREPKRWWSRFHHGKSDELRATYVAAVERWR